MGQTLPKDIIVIGIGSLGGFFSKYMAECDYIKKLTLVDDDIVDNKNHENSIYTKEDIGKLKTHALSIKLFGNNKEIKTKTMQYDGTNISYKDADMIVDCRDIQCFVDNNISFKASISGELLVIDCNKNLHRSDNIMTSGEYDVNIGKEKIKLAASIMSQLISNGFINKLIDNNMKYNIDLFQIEKEMVSELISIKKNRPEKENIIIDDNTTLKKVSNLLDIKNKIITMNKTQNITFRNDNLSFEKISPKKSIKSVTDIISVIDPIVSVPVPAFSYFLKIDKVENNVIINIIPNSGGA